MLGLILRLHVGALNLSKGRTSVNNDTRSGRPATAVTEEIVKKVEKTVLANRLVTSIGSVHNILHNFLGMKKVSAR